MVANTIIIISMLVFVFSVIFIRLNKKTKSAHIYNVDLDRYTFDNLINFVKEQFNDILKTNLYEMNLSKEEFNKRMHNRKQLRKALKSCSYGEIRAKNYVKSFIRDILVNLYTINESNINKVINFDDVKTLSSQDKFEILLFSYKKKYGMNAFEHLIEENGLDRPKEIEYGITYAITKEEIDVLYLEKVKRLIRFQDKLEIVVQRIYQQYKGYSVIDELRDMKIDGISGGVSGIPPSFAEEIDVLASIQTVSNLPLSYDSIWVFFKGKTIHLKFLSFGSEKELIRVCKNIYRYNNPGQLSETNGYKVNEMKDGSRIVVARPPFSESWVFFVRKFDSIKKTDIHDLIIDENSELPINVMKWLIKGCRITAITGSQGTGKTTLLMALVKFINPAFSLRIQEMSFELHLRKIYPFRNIVTFRETDKISGQEGLDLQKKTDGTVNILGEVATAPVSSFMIQMAQVASLFTLFTHHAKTTDNLIFSLRNNLLQTQIFSNERVAEEQVAEVINYDIHLNKSVTGHRYVERITEIIPISHFREYPKDYQKQVSTVQKAEYFMDTMNEFFVRMTDRKTFETRDIIRFNKGFYEVVHSPSKKSIGAIKSYLSQEDELAFDTFLDTHFGGE